MRQGKVATELCKVLTQSLRGIKNSGEDSQDAKPKDIKLARSLIKK